MDLERFRTISYVSFIEMTENKTGFENKMESNFRRSSDYTNGNSMNEVRIYYVYILYGMT